MRPLFLLLPVLFGALGCASVETRERATQAPPPREARPTTPPVRHAAYKVEITKEDVRDFVLDFAADFAVRSLCNLAERELTHGPRQTRKQVLTRSLVSSGFSTVERSVFNDR